MSPPTRLARLFLFVSITIYLAASLPVEVPKDEACGKIPVNPDGQHFIISL